MELKNFRTSNAILAMLLEQQEIESLKQGVGLVEGDDGYETHAGAIYSSKDIITLRDGAGGGLGSTPITGIIAKNYNGTIGVDGQLGFDSQDRAWVGNVANPRLLASLASNELQGILIYDTEKKEVSTKAENELDVGLLQGNAASIFLKKDESATVNGVHDYVNGLKINNNTISYDGVNDEIVISKNIRIQGNILGEGNVVAFAEGSDVGSLFDALPIASKTSKGIVQVGTGINVTDGIISLDASAVTPQSLLLSGNDLSISNGNTINLSSLSPDLSGYASETYVDTLLNDYSLTTHQHNSTYALLAGSGTQDFAVKNLSAVNLNVSGTITQVDTEIVKSTNDLIITRDGATTGLINGTYTGIQATKYDGTNDGQLVFGADGFARVGDVGQLQILSTREDSPLSGGIAYFDSVTKQFKTKSESSLSVSYASNADKLDGLNSTSFMRATTDGSYYGLVDAAGSSANWIRTTANGIIPHSAGVGSKLGTSTWQFDSIYGNKIFATSKLSVGGTHTATEALDVNGNAKANILYATTATNNTIPNANGIKVDGYGIIVNRSALHLTNNNASGQIHFNISGAHGANGVARFTNTGLSIKTGTEPTEALEVGGNVSWTGELRFNSSTGERRNFYHNNNSANSHNYMIWQNNGQYLGAPEFTWRTNGGTAGIGTERMVLTYDGKLKINGGIGTGAEKLQVNGTVLVKSGKFIADNGNTSSLQLGRLDNNITFNFNHAGNDMRIYSPNGTGSDILFGVDSGGNVYDNKIGIGTASPTKTLDVNGDAVFNGSSSGDALKVTINAASYTASYIQNSGSGRAMILKGGSSSGEIAVFRNSSDSTKHQFYANGNYIAQGNIQASGTLITKNFNQTGARAISSSGGTSGVGGWVKLATLTVSTGYVNTGCKFVIGQRGREVTTISMFLSNGASHTSSVSYFRHDNYSSGFQAKWVRNSNNTGELWVKKSENYDGVYLMEVIRPNRYVNYLSLDFTTEFTTSTPSGIVSTTDALPQNILAYEINAQGNITAEGTVKAYSTSDKRLKQNIQPLTSSLDTINKINTYSFDYNKKGKELMNLTSDERYDTGVIAQELKEIPELSHVVGNIYDEYLGVKYERLIPHLIGAIQQLSKEISELKKQS